MCTFALAVAVKGKETFNQLNRNAGAHKKQPLSNNAGRKKCYIVIQEKKQTGIGLASTYADIIWETGQRL